MPTFEVEMGGKRYEVQAPSIEAAVEAYRSRQTREEPSTLADVTKSGARGIKKGFTSFALAPGAAEADLMAGAVGEPPEIMKSVPRPEEINARLPKPQTTAGRYAESIGEAVGNPASWIGPGSIAGKAAANVLGAAGAQAGEELTGSAAGRFAGGLAGAAAPRTALRGVSPLPMTPERQAMLNTLRREGIEPTAGQATGRRSLQYAESHLGEMPLAGGATEAANVRTAEQFNQYAFRQAGYNSNRASQDAIDGMYSNLERQFNLVKGRNDMVADTQWWGRLQNLLQDYQEHVPPSQQLPGVERLVRDLGDAAVNNRGAIPGDVYQAARSRFASLARSHRSDPEYRRALNSMAATMDDAMERGLAASGSPDLGRFRDLRRQWRNAIAIEKAVGVGQRANDIVPGKLRQALIGDDRRAYRRGRGDMAEVTNAADMLLAPLPQSGTAPRQAMGHMASTLGAATGAGIAGLPGAIAGAAAPGLAGRALMSRPVQGYLQNQAARPYIPQTPSFPWSVYRGGLDALAPSDDALSR